MAAKYVVKKGITGKLRFSLVAPNGQIVATSEAYETKRAALAGIESVRRNAGAPVEDLTAATSSSATKAAARTTTANKSSAKKVPARKAAAQKRTTR